MKLLSKHFKFLNNSLLQRQTHFNLIQCVPFHTTNTFRGDETKNEEPSTITEHVEEFSETVKQTLIPLRTYEKRPSPSFYDTVEFYGSPRNKTVILFPSEAYLGMCKRGYEIPRVKEMYNAASQYLGIDMYKLSCKGPIRDLAMQTFQQPAVFLASLAASEKLRMESPYAVENCVATAGFSIGELTSLVFTGALSFEDGLRLSMLRGEAMYVASEEIEGGLMTVYHKPEANLQVACQYGIEVCDEGLDTVIACDIANFISPKCKVIGGNILALRYLQQNADKFDLYKLKEISHVGAFHTPLMKVAVNPFNRYIANTDFDDPLIPVYANDNGKQYESGEDIRHRLGEQICKPIRWEETLYNIYCRENDEISETYICGPSRFLKNCLELNFSPGIYNCYTIEI